MASPFTAKTGDVAVSSKTAMEEFKAAFDFFDENKDGCITKEELALAMNKCGQRPSKLDIAIIMNQGDHDNNGVITFDEFASLMSGSAGRFKYTYSQLREQFDMFDKDKDGYIEKTEMIQIVAELALGSSFPRHTIEQLFREADVDGDGKISFEEFVLAVN